MVRHNNIIPNQHFHKKWARRVKTGFAQPMQKKARRSARAEKAAAVAPAPVSGALRPLVQCPTRKVSPCTCSTLAFSLQGRQHNRPSSSDGILCPLKAPASAVWGAFMRAPCILHCLQKVPAISRCGLLSLQATQQPPSPDHDH